jgi:hypothetical protein
MLVFRDNQQILVTNGVDFALFSTETGETAMSRRILHRRLMRGPRANRAAALLLLGLLAVLVLSVLHGVRSLPPPLS